MMCVFLMFVAERDVACSFEYDWCSWTPDGNFEVGEASDVHADGGNGKYTYVSINGSHEFSQDVLKSERLAEYPTGLHKYCFHFW